MYLTQTNNIRGLSKYQYYVLRLLCQYSNNLYNVGLYNIRQHYFNEKQFLTYESNYHVCKENENYSLLQAGVAQQTLKVVDRSFKSFFNLIKKAKSGEYRYQDISIPHYRKKGGLFNLVLSKNAISIKNGCFNIPFSRAFREQHADCDIKIPFPERIEPASVKEVRIIPVNNGNFFKIQYVYEIETDDKNLDIDNTLAIDIGVDNLATCVTNNGTSFIMDGRKIKSINHYYNQRLAMLSSIADKQGFKRTNRISNITRKRNNQCKDIIRKTARYIMNYCIDNNIGTIVVGYNKDFKRDSDIGKKNNQNFVQIPFGDLRETIKNLCERYNIQYLEVEESYTSKSSFLDLDPLPEYKAEQPYTGNFSGKRIKRGLYRSSDGTLINADVNGACNILRKSEQNFDFEELCRGLLASPFRIRVA